MEITTAREIITQAKADETFDGPMPEDDATAIKTAEEIVQMAEQAWAQNIRSAEVEKILNLASGGNGSGPQAEAGQEDEPVAEPEDLSEFPENLTKMEPWEGYGDERVSDVTGGINFYIEHEPDAAAEVLRHVWVYEQSHKRRVRILDYIQKAGERVGIQIGQKTDAAPSGQTEGVEAEQAGESVPQEPGPEVSSPDGEAGSGIPADEPGVPEEQQEKQEAAPADAIPEPKPEAPAESAESGHGEHEAEPPAENRSEGSGGYQKLIERVEDELLAERLDVPKPPEEKAPDLPWRWGDISDSDLRDYLMQFASLAYYKGYLLSRDERIALHCKEAADTLRNSLMVQIDKYDDHNKEKKVGLIEAEIESDENVRKWRRLQRRHEQMALAAKREMESYQKVYEALSRLETMRHNSWERARR
jgi:hypothetical protein